MCDPTIWQPGFDLPRQQWSLLNRFCTEQGHCGACRRKWRLTDTDLCPCGETQTMSHIVEICPLTKLNGSLSQLHSADGDAVSWLTNYGKWHAYEKKSAQHTHTTAQHVAKPRYNIRGRSVRCGTSFSVQSNFGTVFFGTCRFRYIISTSVQGPIQYIARSISIHIIFGTRSNLVHPISEHFSMSKSYLLTVC